MTGMIRAWGRKLPEADTSVIRAHSQMVKRKKQLKLQPVVYAENRAKWY
jgi:hypothetical protein